MLRNPVEAVYAFYYENIYQGNEVLGTFEQALETEADRKRGRRIPKQAFCVSALFYRHIFHYAQQIERYLSHFGATNVHVTLFDDFTRDTQRIVCEVFQFLGVKSDVQVQLEQHNPNAQVRLSLLKSLTSPNMRPEWYHRLLVVARRVLPQFVRRWFSSAISSVNTEVVDRPPMRSEMQIALNEEFNEDIVQLETMLDIDLSVWKV